MSEPLLRAPLLLNLLQDIEYSEQTRDEFDLTKLCERKSDLYGKAGSNERRDVQKKFDQIRRKSPASYGNYLDDKRVNRSQALQREIRLAEAETEDQAQAQAQAKDTSDFLDSSSSDETISTTTQVRADSLLPLYLCSFF